MDLKALFKDSALTYEQFLEATAGMKLVDLNEGLYVSKNKYEDELHAKDAQIEKLNGTIKSRDTDLSDLQTKLAEAGTDTEKLAALQTDFTGLQSKYDNEVKSYKEQLKKQAYEFAVKEFANSKQFTSNAAKRDFIQSMIAKDLKMEKDRILGADDFVATYSEDNSDAFVVAQAEPEPTEPKPVFAGPTAGPTETTPDMANGFVNAFNFIGVRPQPAAK